MNMRILRQPKVEKVRAHLEVETEKACPTCHGDGQDPAPYYDVDYASWERQTCSKCRGSGRVVTTQSFSVPMDCIVVVKEFIHKCKNDMQLQERLRRVERAREELKAAEAELTGESNAGE